MMTRTLLFCAGIVATAVAADVIPDDRKPPSWEVSVATGVEGGIDAVTSSWTIVNATTAATPILTTNTAAQNTTALNTIKATAPTLDKIIFIPAGEYQFTTISPGTRQEIRGDEMFETTLLTSGGASIGQNPTFSVPGVAHAHNPQGTVSEGFTRNSYTVVVASTNGKPFVGQRLVRFLVPHDGDVPTIGATYCRSFVTLVDSVTGSGPYTLNLDTPVPADFTTTTASPVLAEQAQLATVQKAGYRDLTIKGNGSGGYIQNGLVFEGGCNLWAKNVRIMNHTNYGVKLGGPGSRYEMTGCFIQGPLPVPTGSSKGGIEVAVVSNCAIYDNITYRSGQGGGIFGQAVNGSTGNVYAYNAFVEDQTGVTGNHFAHPTLNLVEGNWMPNARNDNYHGSNSHDTYVGNAITGIRVPDTTGWNTATGLPTKHLASMVTGTITSSGTGAAGGYCVALLRWSRDMQLMNNILGCPGWITADTSYIGLGYPNIGTSGFTVKSSFNGYLGLSPDRDWNTTTKLRWSWPGVVISSSPVDSNTTAVTIDMTGAPGIEKIDERIQDAKDNLQAYDGGRVSFSINWGTSSSSAPGYTGTFLTGDNYLVIETDQTIPPNDEPVTVSVWSTGMQTLDMDVIASIIARNNYRVDTGALLTQANVDGMTTMPDNGTLQSGETIAVSYAFPSGHSFGGFSTVTKSVAINNIAAGQRFLNWIQTGTFEAPGDSEPATYSVGGSRPRVGAMRR
ncbi:MAG TPA: hypothetical protein VEB21_07590 [Terriglobales bacterium]|nr:hypothetical protein [Terriglobales bacterium]